MRYLFTKQLKKSAPGFHRAVTTVSMSPTVSLIAFSAMALLAILEFFVYRDTWMKYEYSVDKDFSR